MIKFFEGLSTFIFDLWRREFSAARCGAGSRTSLMRPGVGRIRDVFDYEQVGGSPLLGVAGTVIITHGRAKRRMIGVRLRGGRDDGADRVSRHCIAEALAANRAQRRPHADRAPAVEAS